MSQCDIKNERCGFECTGSDESATWEKLHNLPKGMNCEKCAHHAEELFTGIHDHVNAGLGKMPKNKTNYKKFHDEVRCVYETCVKEGRC